MSARKPRPTGQRERRREADTTPNQALAPPSALDWLIHPVRKESFFADYWEKLPLLARRGQRDYFASLLSLDEVDRVLTTLDRRHPDVTLKNACQEITSADYTLDGDVLDVAKVYQLFGEGSTIALAFLDNVVPSLSAFARQLENELSFPCQTNVYLTPPAAQGAKPHYDTHDVFVLQVAGAKRWHLYGTPVELPLSGQEFDAAVHERGAPTLEFDLQEGDSIYIPRGLVHDARAGDEVSLHITVGILCFTWMDLLLEWVADAGLNDPAFRKALPPGFARQGFDAAAARPLVQDLWRRVSAQTNFAQIMDRFADEFMASSPPLLRGQLAQFAALPRLSINSRVGVRPGVNFRMNSNPEAITVECYGRIITFPSSADDAVRFALSRANFAPSDLPANLDDAGKLTLIRRLVREGLVEVLPSSSGVSLRSQSRTRK